MNNLKKIKVLLSLSALFGLLLVLPSGPTNADDKIKIGAICSLSGPAAGFGKPYCDAFKAYVKVWNTRGGSKGKKIELAILDDETNGVTAVNAFRRHAGDKDIDFIWLAISSNSTLSVKPLASEAKIPIVSGGAADAIGIPADPYLFKVAPGTKAFGEALMAWAQKQGIKSIATITATDAYGQSEKNNIKAHASKFGIKVLAQETFALSDTNFNAQLIRIRNSKPDLVFSGATGGPAILVFKQYKQLRLSPPLSLSQGAINRAFFKAIGGPKAANGILMATNQGTLGSEIGGVAGQEYAKLEKALGHSAMIFNTFGWDHGLVTEWAFNNSDGSREGVRSALDKIKEIEAINGPFNYKPDNHIGQDSRGLRVAIMKGGKFVLADKLPGK